MILLHCTTRKEYEDSIRTGIYGKEKVEKEGFLHFSTWNSFAFVAPAFYAVKEDLVFLCMESKDCEVPIKWEDGGTGILYPHVYGVLPITCIREVVPFLHDDKEWLNKKECIHVLMNIPAIDEDWCYSYLKKVISPNHTVCILALSFFDDVKNADDWEKSYGVDGMWTASCVKVWERYGIQESQISWVNYFKDTKEMMISNIINSDILLLPGGAPDLFMKRIHDAQLTELLESYQGLMIGYSAGAMIQIKEYHITPDIDYDVFSYETGLNYLKDFDIEVHYTGSLVQEEAINKVCIEKQKDIYALYDTGGLCVKEEGIEVFGDVKKVIRKAAL